MNLDIVALIAAMTAITYLTRISGFLVGPTLPKIGRGRQALDAMPVAVLTAMIAPALLSGPVELIGGVTTLALAWRYPAILAVAAGVVTVAILRGIG